MIREQSCQFGPGWGRGQKSLGVLVAVPGNLLAGQQTELEKLRSGASPPGAPET